MLFNSLGFILGFLPLVIAGAYVLARRGTSGIVVGWLVGMSLVFYGWWDWGYVSLIVGSLVGNFLAALLLERHRHTWLLSLAVGANLAVLGWYKYANFAAANLNAVLGASIDFGDIVLPLAISFHTFQQIAYVVDVRRGAAAERDLARYALFVTFFPQLLAGPIVHHDEALPQFHDRRFPHFDAALVRDGILLFTIGLIKKVVFATPCADYSDRVFGAVTSGVAPSFVTAWSGTLAFTLQIYFDFSGYSDMAIGLALMLGVRLPVNFNSPYQATSIIEFWRRWHITLSRFLRDYLYIPLGGNRQGPLRRHTNLMVVMLLGGLWHGANWTFVVWGGLHGTYLILNHAWHRLAPPSDARWRKPLGWLLTMVAVMVAWVFFRASDFATASSMLAGMAGVNGISVPESYGARLGTMARWLSAAGIHFGVGDDAFVFPGLPQLAALGGLALLAVLAPNSQTLRVRWNQSRIAAHVGSAPAGVAMAVAWVVCLALIAKDASDAFIYFQF